MKMFALFASLVWLFPALVNAAGTPPAWVGVGSCQVANPRSYPDARNAIPDHATWMSGKILSYPTKARAGKIEAWIDASDIEYVCDFQTDTPGPLPGEWIWVSWDKNASYANYTLAPVTFTTYNDPSGGDGGPGSSGTGTSTGGVSVLQPCYGSNWSSAQQNTIYSHYCQREALYHNECLYSATSGNAYLYFYTLPDAATCEARNSGAGEVTVFPNGSICDGLCKSGGSV